MLLYCVEVRLHGGLKGFQGGTILGTIHVNGLDFAAQVCKLDTNPHYIYISLAYMCRSAVGCLLYRS